MGQIWNFGHFNTANFGCGRTTIYEQNLLFLQFVIVQLLCGLDDTQSKHANPQIV